MDAYEFGQAVGGIIGVILVILLAVYLISKLTGRGKRKAGKSGMEVKSGSRTPSTSHSAGNKQKINTFVDKTGISGNEPERSRQKWV